MTVPLWNLPEIGDGSSQIAGQIINGALRVYGAQIPHVLQDLALATPPGSPAESSVYFVAATATDAWVGHEDELATFINGGWHFRPLLTGERWYDASTVAWYEWNGASWDAL